VFEVKGAMLYTCDKTLLTQRLVAKMTGYREMILRETEKETDEKEENKSKEDSKKSKKSKSS